MDWFSLVISVLKSRKVQAVVASGLLAVATFVGLPVTSEEAMSWVVANWDAILGIAGGLYGLWQRRKAKRTASDLDRIRAEAGTKATDPK